MRSISGNVYGSFFSFLLTCCLLACGNVVGQNNWTHAHFSTPEGLPDRAVNFVAKDSFGYTWLATETGLVRFDGQLFSRPPFLEELGESAGNIVREMILDPQGRLLTWMGGSDFLQFINTRTYKVAKPNYGKLGSPSGAHRHFLLKSGQAALELRQKNDSIFIYRLEESGSWVVVERISLDQSRPSESDRLLGIRPDGSYLLYLHRSQQLIVVLDGEIIQSIPVGTEEIPRLLYLDGVGRTWLENQPDSLLRVLPPGHSDFTLADNALQNPEQPLNAVFEDQMGNLIMGRVLPTNTHRLLSYDLNGEITNLSEILRVERKIVSISGKNFKQGFDLATYAGLYRFRRPLNRMGRHTRYLYDPNLPDNDYGYVMRGFAHQPKTDCIYGNTEGALWLRLCPPNLQLDTFYPGDGSGRNIGAGHNLIVEADYVYGLYARAEGKEIKGFLTRYNTENDQWEDFELPRKNLFGRFVLALPDGELLVFTYQKSDQSSVIYRYNPASATFSYFGTLPIRSRSSVKNAIYDPGRRQIWVATGSGLFSYPYCSPQDDCYFDTMAVKQYPKINFYVQSITLSKKGDLWLGTYGEGVQAFDPEKDQLSTLAYHTPSPQKNDDVINLPSNLIAELLPLNDDYLAITTFEGLVIAEVSSRQAILYERQDGLPDNEFNRLSALMSPNGEVALGGINGFILLSREGILPRPTGPTPGLSRYYLIDEKEREKRLFYPPPGQSQDEIEVPPGQLYVGLDFRTASASVVGYRTWLENYEPTYGPLRNDGKVEYLRLPAGSYTLHVKALTKEGEESAVPLSLPITVKKPWYLRTWFLLLTQALIIAVIYSFYRQRLKRVRQQEATKRKVDHQLADLELRILRQQLNPHFIFNALGAIQHFIQSMRGMEAMQYLADFARLMRMFLEASKQPYTFLAEELEMIRLYIRLEQLRFEDRFAVKYEIDPALDLDMEDIPSLLLQPFVENAINHGLFHLSRKGTLTIGMQLDDQQRIVCTVIDDGIGRKAAGKLRQKTYQKHTSRATQIVTERLDIFQRSGKTDVTINTEDLYPEREETGTKVTIVVDNQD